MAHTNDIFKNLHNNLKLNFYVVLFNCFLIVLYI